jgi:hypothetical protein
MLPKIFIKMAKIIKRKYMKSIKLIYSGAELPIFGGKGEGKGGA